MQDQLFDLHDTTLCCMVLKRPVLVVSKHIDASLSRLRNVLNTLDQTIDNGGTDEKRKSGIEVIKLFDIENQKNFANSIRKNKYPLIVVMREEDKLEHKLQIQFLLRYYHDIERGSRMSWPDKDLHVIKEKVNHISIHTEVQTYVYDLIVQLRYSRFIKGGIPTPFLFELIELVKFWAYVQDKTFVTPLMVKECFRKALPHRLTLLEAEEEPTLLYGSNPVLVNQLVHAIDVFDVLDIELSKVRPPI